MTLEEMERIAVSVPGYHINSALHEAIRQIRALEAERDALRASVDQLADTLKNVHEAVCETLGIEGDDALPELVADWAEGDLAALRKVADAAENLVKVKGRFHSEQAYQRLVAAIAAKEPK